MKETFSKELSLNVYFVYKQITYESSLEEVFTELFTTLFVIKELF